MKTKQNPWIYIKKVKNSKIYKKDSNNSLEPIFRKVILKYIGQKKCLREKGGN